MITMGFSREFGRKKGFWRGIKTVFFLISMLISLLLFSAPILLVMADILLPSMLFSASVFPIPRLSLHHAISSHLSHYDFKRSLIDIPLISLIRSALILCVYSVCDGPRLSRGPYLAVATICSAISLVFISVKASFAYGMIVSSSNFGRDESMRTELEVAALMTLSACLAIGHVFVAYRTSCRARRKLMVYKIDIEAVSACKHGFHAYQKLHQQERMK